MEMIFKKMIAIVFVFSFLLQSCSSTGTVKKTKKEDWSFDNYLVEVQKHTNKQRYLTAIKLLMEMKKKFPDTEKVMVNYLIGYNYYELKSYKIARSYFDAVFFLFNELAAEGERLENEKFTVLATSLLEKIDKAESSFDPYEIKAERESNANWKIKPAF